MLTVFYIQLNISQAIASIRISFITNKVDKMFLAFKSNLGNPYMNNLLLYTLQFVKFQFDTCYYRILSSQLKVDLMLF
jgi:hypothetical protein